MAWCPTKKTAGHERRTFMRAMYRYFNYSIATAGMVAVAGILLSFPAYAKTAKLAARISAAQAQAAAVKKIPGKVVSSKYEFEDGRWQYAVLVQKGKSLYEV